MTISVEFEVLPRVDSLFQLYHSQKEEEKLTDALSLWLGHTQTESECPCSRHERIWMGCAWVRGWAQGSE